MTFLLKKVFLLLIIAISLQVHAQVYPVNGNAALIPPYSVYLSDYTSRSTERLVLNVVLNDATRPELRVRLRMKIESQNIKLETKSEYIGSEIILQGGIPLRLSGIDLTEYFNPNNLNFAGITRREFEKTGALPEDFYQFSFEVLEYNRGVKISNTISAPGWFILNDPPIVNLPRQNEKLRPTQPQNLIFQWTPRHTGSPNSALATEYTIEMVEVWPANRNPNDAILTSPRILETTTRNTSFIYGPAETPLELGRRYAFRIQAKSLVGVEEYDLFKNKGYSEVISFVYGDACELPGNIRALPGTNKFKILWDGQSNHSGYSFRYRQQDTDNWYESGSSINEVNIYSLSPNTTYEYQVAGACGVFEGEYSPIASLKTNDIGEADYSCELPLETFNLDPTELTGSLKVGDIIQAGDFQVKLTKVSGTNVIFTGEGVIEVPFFNKAKVKAEFSNIAVNKELRMVNGMMNVTGAGVEVVPSGIMDLMDELTETLNQLDSGLNDISSSLPQSFDPHSFVADTLITISAEIKDVYKDFNGTIVVVDQQGNETRLPPGEDYAVKDDNGNGYLIDSKGTIQKTTAEIAVKAANREYNLKLKFSTDLMAKYGFDEFPIDVTGKYAVLRNQYEQLNGNYDVAWKAVASGATDPIIATLEDASLDKSKVRFELFSLPAPATPFNSNQTTAVTATGKSDGTIEDLIALYSSGNPADKDQVLGKVKLITYDKIARHLVIVPVNNNTYPGTAAQLTIDLNKIFGQAAVEWTVEIKDTIEVSLDETFDDGESGLLSNYTDDMKKVIDKYKDSNNIDRDNFYLFLVSNPRSGNKLGYMPRSRQAGFIFLDTHNNNQERLTHTIAHELGHGVFNLQHTFSEFPTMTRGSTDNLMDYSNGTHLFKYQWDNIHQPQIVIGILEGDEAGAAKNLLNSKYVISHFQFGTKAYASNLGQDEFTQDAINEVDGILEQLDTANLKTYIYFGYIWFHPGNISTFDQKIDDAFRHAYDSIKEHVGESNFNLFAIVNAKYDTALANGLKTVSFREKFYPMNGLDAACTKSVNDYIRSNTKKTFVNGLNEALKERAEKLLINLKGCKVEIPPEIVIHYKRMGRNKYRTWGEFTIIGTEYKGYILERPKGDDPTTLEDCKRHPAGTYDLVYSTSATGKKQKFWGVTMCLKEHNSYKLHGGNRADNSDGCFLINKFSPQIDKYPEGFDAKEEDVCIDADDREDNPDRNKYELANDYYPHNSDENPAKILRNYIFNLEEAIKVKYKVTHVVKKIEIDETKEIIDP